MTRREFLSAAFVEPALRFLPPHEPKTQDAEKRVAVAPAAFMSGQASYYANPCAEVAELCFDGCEPSIGCWDGDCPGARCCAEGSFKCDKYHGWWSCLYAYAECIAEIILPYAS
jgi:hypothetical protein